MKWYRLTKGWGQKTKLNQYIIQKSSGTVHLAKYADFHPHFKCFLGISRAEHSSFWTNTRQSLKRLSKQFHLENVCSKSDKATLKSQRNICPASCKLMQTFLLSIVNIREPFQNNVTRSCISEQEWISGDLWQANSLG